MSDADICDAQSRTSCSRCTRLPFAAGAPPSARAWSDSASPRFGPSARRAGTTGSGSRRAAARPPSEGERAPPPAIAVPDLKSIFDPECARFLGGGRLRARQASHAGRGDQVPRGGRDAEPVRGGAQSHGGADSPRADEEAVGQAPFARRQGEGRAEIAAGSVRGGRGVRGRGKGKGERRRRSAPLPVGFSNRCSG